MVYLHILGSGETSSAKANSRGHLFEYLMRDLFENLKIKITHLNQSRNGTEIDITGEHFVGRVPVIAECKAQRDPLASEDVQKFAGKFSLEHHSKSKLSGFIFTLSPLNPKAQEFWDRLKEAYGDSLACYTQDSIVELLINHSQLCSSDAIRHQAEQNYQRICGDTQLLCIEGENKSARLFWAQLLMSTDGTEPNLVVFYNANGNLISEQKTIEQLLHLKPDLDTPDLTCLNLDDVSTIPVTLEDVSPSRTVVRVRMSKDWFDYRFPSAPEFFVGRSFQRNELTSFVDDIRLEKTSTRGIFISGKSGIGKSSLALKVRQELRSQNVIFLPIDSRLCDDISFIFDSINELLYELRQVPALRESLRTTLVRGLDSLIETLTEIHRALSINNYLAVLFFDQFEKVFDYPEVTKAIRTLFLRATERQLLVLFGFAWKSDLWSQAEGFPHSERDDIVRESQPIKQLRQFGQEETSEILKQLDLQWGNKLSTLLHRQLATFSRGLPWLLKKVCAHVLDQKDQGVTEEELIETNLKLRDLFEADLAGLDDEERSLLKAIAPLLPATLRRISESFEISSIDHSLHRFIDKRILVKITEDVGDTYANVKYDAYSDIFREFLVTGTVPLEDAYYFFTYPTGAMKFFEKIRERGSLSIDEEIDETSKQIASIYNLSRDLRELGLVNINDRVFTISDRVKNLESEQILSFIQGQLKRNRVVSLTLAEINAHGSISLERIMELLRELFPSVQATDKTWTHYSRTTARWLHEARLAFYSPRERRLNQVDDEEIFEKIVTRRSIPVMGYNLPVRFRNAIISCLEAIYEHGNGQASVTQLAEWLQKKPTSIQMILSDNLNLGFVFFEKDSETYHLTPEGRQFVGGPEEVRRKLFKQQCSKMEVFNRFVGIVEKSGSFGISSKEAAEKIVQEMGLDLADATVVKLGGILVNWAEYAGIVARSGKLTFMRSYVPEQMSWLTDRFNL